MRKCLIFLLILLLPVTAWAADPPPKADPALVSVLMPGHQLVQGITNRNSDYASMKIIGMADEQWYHVWFYNEGTGGYFRADDLWEGNG